MDFLCVYSTCDRKFVTSEWLARHLERDHAFPPGAARPSPGPTAIEPREDDEDSPVDPNGGPGTIDGTPRRIEDRNGPVKAPPPPPARTRALPRYGRTHPVPLTVPVPKRCPGRGPKSDPGWTAQYNLACGVSIAASRERCAFHRRTP